MENTIYITPAAPADFHGTDVKTPFDETVPLTKVKLESADPDVIEAFKVLMEELHIRDFMTGKTSPHLYPVNFQIWYTQLMTSQLILLTDVRTDSI